MKKCDVFKAISQFLGALGNEKKNKANKSSIVQTFANTMYKTNRVRVTGSGTPLLGKLEPTTATEKKGTKQKKRKNSCAVPATQGASWWGLWFHFIRSEARVTQNGIN